MHDAGVTHKRPSRAWVNLVILAGGMQRERAAGSLAKRCGITAHILRSVKLTEIARSLLNSAAACCVMTRLCSPSEMHSIMEHSPFRYFYSRDPRNLWYAYENFVNRHMGAL